MRAYTDIQRPIERRVMNGKPGSQTNLFCSLKNRRQVACESALEASFCLTLEYEPSVASYIPQPEQCWVERPGRGFRYTPDFEVFALSGDSYLAEIKPDYILESKPYQEKLIYIRQHYAAYGRDFRLIVESDIRTTPYIENLEILHSLVKAAKPDNVSKLIPTLLKFGGSASIGSLNCACDTDMLPAVAAAHYARSVKVDHRVLLSIDSMVSLAEVKP